MAVQRSHRARVKMATLGVEALLIAVGVVLLPGVATHTARTSPAPRAEPTCAAAPVPGTEDGAAVSSQTLASRSGLMGGPASGSPYGTNCTP